MPAVGDVIDGKYEIESLLGEGGMGAVFAAAHKLTGKRVALKWMLPELARDEAAVQRFLREAQAAGRIDHPNVVDVYDVGQHEGSWYLVMELLSGEPLSAALEGGNLSAPELIRILVRAMRGVAAAHRKGVVHRDLKPDNIFLSHGSDGRPSEPKVLDFGISKLSAGDSNVNPRLTKTGAVVGTPYYMSPEQVRGSRNVDHRADVYAFGVILYETLTGSVPFSAETYSALILEIATGTPKPPRELNPGLSPDLARVIMKAMARELEDRYPDIEALAVALEPFGDGARFRSVRPDPTGSQSLSLAMDTPATPFTTDAGVDVDAEVTIPTSRTRPLVIGAAVLLLASAAGYALIPGGRSDGSEHLVEPAAASGGNPTLADVAAAPAPGTMAEATASDAGLATPDAAVESAPVQKAASAAPAPSATAARSVDKPRKRRPRAAPRVRTSPAPPPPAPRPAARPSASPRGRTGSLEVDEF